MNNLNRRNLLRAAGGVAVARLASAKDLIAVGFIGVGSRGTFLLRNLLQVKGVAVHALCDIQPERLEEARKLVTSAGQPEPLLFHDWKQLLHRKDIDAVVSALPCHLHAAAYLDVIASRKDLYGEKPMCITREDCDKVVAAATRSDQVVQIGLQRRADPRYIETMAQIHQGEIGDLVEGRILWSNAWGPLYGWFGHRKESGDWIVEQAVHGWDVMNWANRCPPRRAMGLGRNDLFREQQPDRDVHDYYTASVEYENGVIVNIIHSWVSPGKFNDDYVRLIGTRGGVDFNSGNVSYRRSTGKPDRASVRSQGEINNTLLALESFIESVRTRKPPRATVQHGREAVLTCLLVRQAVYTGRVVSMKEILA